MGSIQVVSCCVMVFGLPGGVAFHVEQLVWALVVAALLASLVIHFRVRRRLKRLAETTDRLEAELLERTQALRAVSESLQETNRILENQSLTDPLTGLRNRRFLSLVVEEDACRVLRAYREANDGQPIPNEDLVFFMVDLDHFKQVNDHYGHGVGDRLLQRTAEILKKAARESDAVIRMGGEEFLLLARRTSRREAPLVAERLRCLVAEEALHQGEEVIRWTVSVGFAAFPFQTSDLDWVHWERVVEIADACLYAAKNSGRNAWVGIEATGGLDRAAHGQLIPWEMGALLDEGVLAVVSNRKDPFKRKTKQIFG